MRDALRQALTHRITSLASATAALTMGVLLALSWSTGTVERTALERRITHLTEQAERSKALWKTQLAACHAAGPGERLTTAAYDAPADARDATQRLLTEQPEGIDVCARMESADQNVLSTLK